jgi:hypothetical protein
VLVGVPDRLRAVAHARLGEEPVDVRLHGRLAQHESPCDLCVRQSCGDDAADAVKLVLLAGFVAAATALAARAGVVRRWLRIAASALVVLLPLGGASFLVPSSVRISALLSLLLVVSLPVLLVWAGTIAYQVGRHSLR